MKRMQQVKVSVHEKGPDPVNFLTSTKHSISGTCLPVPRIFTQLAHNCARRPKKLLSVFKGRALRPQMDGLIDGKGGITLSR